MNDQKAFPGKGKTLA
jgi:hypothetical protein